MSVIYLGTWCKPQPVFLIVPVGSTTVYAECNMNDQGSTFMGGHWVRNTDTHTWEFPSKTFEWVPTTHKDYHLVADISLSKESARDIVKSVTMLDMSWVSNIYGSDKVPF